VSNKKTAIFDEMKRSRGDVDEDQVIEWANRLIEASEPKEALEMSIKSGLLLTASLALIALLYIFEVQYWLPIVFGAIILLGARFLENLHSCLTITGEE